MNVEKLTTAALIESYADAAREHGEATERGDYKRGNRSYETIATAYREIRRRGVKSELLELLKDADLGVRGWAASHCLEFAPDEAAPILLSIVRSAHGPLALSAEMVLEEWKAGTLRFP